MPQQDIDAWLKKGAEILIPITAANKTIFW